MTHKDDKLVEGWGNLFDTMKDYLEGEGHSNGIMYVMIDGTMHMIDMERWDSVDDYIRHINKPVSGTFESREEEADYNG